MKIGVLGFRGRVGSVLASNGCIPIDIDIRDRVALKEARLDDYDVIINCAAKTKVDEIQHPEHKSTPAYEQAVRVNTTGANNLRSVFSGRLIHLSTDYVFKGDKGPYIENDRCDPVDDYGYTKWGGEVMLSTYPFDFETVIVRTTGLYGSDKDFGSTVLQHLREGEPILASSELLGNQTYIPHLCEALMSLAQMKFMPEVVTYVHVASQEVISRHAFACQLADAFGFQEGIILSCNNSDIENWVAPRPSRGGLIVTKAQRMGIPIYTIAEGLEAYKERMK